MNTDHVDPVLHVVDSLGVGGVETGLASLIERTDDVLAHHVVCVRAAGATAERLARLGIPITVLGKGPGHHWALSLRFARYCRTVAPAVVHTRNWGTVDAIVGARLARVPVVVHCEHGRDFADVSGANRRRQRIRQVVSYLTDRMLAVSTELAHWLTDVVHVPARKVVVVGDGVDDVRFAPRADRDALRRALGYRPDDVVVGTVGRLDPVKNHPMLFAAADRIRHTHPNVRVLLVGDGPERSGLERLLEERRLHETVKLLGQRDDIPELLNVMDIFTLSSFAEGVSVAALEAMAVDLPVVATRVGGNVDVVVEGVTGALVPSGDVDAYVAALTPYVASSELRRTHGQRGRALVMERFTLDALAARYVGLYRELLAAKGLDALAGAIR